MKGVKGVCGGQCPVTWTECPKGGWLEGRRLQTWGLGLWWKGQGH